jgi:hypothetical protein
MFIYKWSQNLERYTETPQERPQGNQERPQGNR